MHKTQSVSRARRASAVVRIASLVGTIGAVGTVGSAHGSFVATLGAYGPGEYARCGYRASYAWDSTSALNTYNIRAFQHDFLATTGSGDGDLAGGSTSVLRTWCVQVYQSVGLGETYDFDLVPVESVPSQGHPGPMGVVRANVVRDLFARWIDASTGYVVGDAADRDAKSAAFQLAVWEITHENFGTTDETGIVSRMSLDLGAFRSTPSTAALGWYDAIRQSLGSNGFRNFDVQGLAHPTAQDQIFTPVPAPAAIGLFGAAGVLARRRRR
jgi:hypothetical protein